MRTVVIAVIAAGLAAAPTARAADPIVGADVMGDKGRAGPDGWSWAPVTRNQAPSGQAAGRNDANVHASPNAQPDPGAGRTLPPGQDPGTPAVAASSGPGNQAASSGVRRP